MTAPDHTTKPLENILRERGHPYMSQSPIVTPVGNFQVRYISGLSE